MHHTSVIIGGGMSGCLIALLLAAYRKPGEDVAVIEPGQLGGSFSRGGFQYLRNSEGVRALLDHHHLPYTLRPMRGGILTHKGRVLAYPAGLGDRTAQAQRLHYRKTRGTLEGFEPGVMNFGGEGGEQVLVDLSRLLMAVERVATIYRAQVSVVSGPMACIGPRRWVEASGGHLVSTLPLPLLARILQLDEEEAPRCRHETLNVARIPLTEDNAPLGHYDYTYTPWLEAIHRVRPVNGASGVELELEWNAALDVEDDQDGVSLPNTPVTRDIDKLAGALDTLEVRTMPGHLHPVEWGTWRPEPPLRLAGRFAQWEPRMTVDKVADAWYKELNQ